jgi:hypothetical protein
MKLLATRPVEAHDEPDHRWSTLQTPETFRDQIALKPFQKVLRRVEEKESGKQDITVPFADIKFVDETGAIDVRDYGRVLMTPLAFTQLCTRLRIPADYMERCPLALRNSNLSYWVEQNDERKVLLRIRRFPEREAKKKEVGHPVRSHH